MRRFVPRLPLDALVMGTMAPDFEYVLRLSVRGGSWHRPANFLLLAIPTALLACIVFRVIVRPAFVPLLPRGLVAPPARATWPLTVAAVLVGALTHVFWDGFTHQTGWFVALVPALRQTIGETPLPWFNLLQHLSTLAGGLVIAAWIAAEVRARPADARRFAPGQARRAATVALVVLGTAVIASVANGTRALGSGLEWVLAYAAVGGMAGLAVSAIVYGFLIRIPPTTE